MAFLSLTFSGSTEGDVTDLLLPRFAFSHVLYYNNNTVYYNISAPFQDDCPACLNMTRMCHMWFDNKISLSWKKCCSNEMIPICLWGNRQSFFHV